MYYPPTSVMVLDNHEAKIQVGDQVPNATQQQQSTEGLATVINSIEYRDTGITLTVKPKVNPGGLVTMEIVQEVSNALETESSSLDSPTIQTRNISSTVAVQSGQGVVLGGLIRNETQGGQGVSRGFTISRVSGPCLARPRRRPNAPSSWLCWHPGSSPMSRMQNGSPRTFAAR